jgi:hypothetical protein
MTTAEGITVFGIIGTALAQTVTAYRAWRRKEADEKIKEAAESVAAALIMSEKKATLDAETLKLALETQNMESRKVAAALTETNRITEVHRGEVKGSLDQIKHLGNGILLAHQKTIWDLTRREAERTGLKEDLEIAAKAEKEYKSHLEEEKKSTEQEKEKG